ncbi:MAG: hypothetical protein KIT83_18440 [Bryobacterales bacterium]|nr:hypothetical protein [Bryobacterales bacterium]
MTTRSPLRPDVLDAVLDHIDIPRSYYEKAIARHKSLGAWLCRPESKHAALNPHVSAQGSFRFGTVIRPLDESAEYDLDNVTKLQLEKTALTQKTIKELYGYEVKAYARANGIIEPVEEMHRCWRLHYADEINFHLDTLPSLPEDPARIAWLQAQGVPADLAKRAIAITDRRHPQYEQITADLQSSNPSGFARWFESRVRPVAEQRIRKLVEARVYARVDDVPPYDWKTPLQRSIQLLKRHRDIMFRDNLKQAPISMIITNLAAHAYDGQTDIAEALLHIVDTMPSYVLPTRPRVPNPTDPAEDYADKWTKDPTLEDSFWLWHNQLTADITQLATAYAHRRLHPTVKTIFDVQLTNDELRTLEPPPEARITVVAAPAITLFAAPKPWSNA